MKFLVKLITTLVAIPLSIVFGVAACAFLVLIIPAKLLDMVLINIWEKNRYVKNLEQ